MFIGRGIITLIEIDLRFDTLPTHALLDQFRGENEGHGFQPRLHAVQRDVGVIPAESEGNGAISLSQ